MQIDHIQQELRSEDLDGWLFFDHHHRDPLAYRVLGLAPEQQVTRRWYYLIPQVGEPRGLVHRVECEVLSALPGEKTLYSSWKEQIDGLARILRGCQNIAMQYSPQCAIPYVAMVDAGTIEMVRGLGVEISSSAELVQHFEARWTEEQLQSHLEAGRKVDNVRRCAFDMIREKTRAGQPVQEIAVKSFILDHFAAAGLQTDHGPVVGANVNSANPHYEPTQERSAVIRSGDFVLLDMWAKLNKPNAVYYDITWTGYCGNDPPEEIRRVFHIVTTARDLAIDRVRKAAALKETLRGFEVDDAARNYIASKGFSEFFTHRTGHSIGQDVHGNGANMDNLETHDERRIVPGTCFSIEPGIYLEKFGVRSEVNVFRAESEAYVTGEMQQELVIL